MKQSERSAEVSDQPACAHTTVHYAPLVGEDGSRTERWCCAFGCGAEFVPAQRVEALRVAAQDVLSMFRREQDEDIRWWEGPFEAEINTDALDALAAIIVPEGGPKP